jgi:hypothetical protein
VDGGVGRHAPLAAQEQPVVAHRRSVQLGRRYASAAAHRPRPVLAARLHEAKEPRRQTGGLGTHPGEQVAAQGRIGTDVVSARQAHGVVGR